MDTIITADRNDIHDAIAMGFSGSIHFVDGRAARGNITPCDMVNDRHTGEFTECTVWPRTGYQAPRRFRLADVVAIEVKDI